MWPIKHPRTRACKCNRVVLLYCHQVCTGHRMHGKQEIRTGSIDAKTTDREGAGIGPRLGFYSLLCRAARQIDLLVCSVGRTRTAHGALRLLAHFTLRVYRAVFSSDCTVYGPARGLPLGSARSGSRTNGIYSKQRCFSS